MDQPSSTFKQLTSWTPTEMLVPTSHSRRECKHDWEVRKLRPSILVVDDDPSLLKTIHDALDLRGFEMLSAKNGREGLDVLTTHNVDGILLDVDMPVMDGLTMLDELRWLGYQTPVVMMSGRLQGPALRQLAKEGAQGFMSKPFSLSFLGEVCTTIFESQCVGGRSADHSRVA